MKKKKRLIRILSIVTTIILVVTTSFVSSAKEENSKQRNLNHIDVYINGTITIDTQVNGVSISKQNADIVLSNLSATIVDNGKSQTYSNFSTQTQIGSREREFHKNVSSFSTSAVITIKGTMKCDKLGINTTFEKTFSGTGITQAVAECPVNSGCDFRITEEEIINTVTHNVIFKTEEGGFINNDTANVLYANIIDNTAFPEVPKVTPKENYKFLGWYDENNNVITSFPKTVTKDMSFIAKWVKLTTPTVKPTAVPTPVITPTVKPTAVPTPVITPTVKPTAVPTPVITPTVKPTAVPTPVITPTVKPTAVPTPVITATVKPTINPTPTVKPVCPVTVPAIFYLLKDGLTQPEEIYSYPVGNYSKVGPGVINAVEVANEEEVNENIIELPDLTNFSSIDWHIKWYVIKLENDGWHVDGIKVKTTPVPVITTGPVITPVPVITTGPVITTIPETTDISSTVTPSVTSEPTPKATPIATNPPVDKPTPGFTTWPTSTVSIVTKEPTVTLTPKPTTTPVRTTPISTLQPGPVVTPIATNPPVDKPTPGFITWPTSTVSIVTEEPTVTLLPNPTTTPDASPNVSNLPISNNGTGDNDDYINITTNPIPGGPVVNTETPKPQQTGTINQTPVSTGTSILIPDSNPGGKPKGTGTPQITKKPITQKNVPGNNVKQTYPKTGDTTSVIPWIILMILSALVVVITTITLRSKKH